MAAELTSLLSAVPAGDGAGEYLRQVVNENRLGKPTAGSRRTTYDRLRLLYGLDPADPLFSTLRALWDAGREGRPLLAVLTAVARDPLLAATVPVVLSAPLGEELPRGELSAAVAAHADGRLGESTLASAARNVASTWTQSGHLEGRSRKTRRAVAATPAAAAMALLVGAAAGFAGPALFRSGWARLLDRTPDRVRTLAAEAARDGLIQLRIAGDVVEVARPRGAGGICLLRAA